MSAPAFRYSILIDRMSDGITFLATIHADGTMVGTGVSLDRRVALRSAIHCAETMHAFGEAEAYLRAVRS